MKNERLTRKEIIDSRLKQAGWIVTDRTQVIEEFDIHLTVVQDPSSPYSGVVERILTLVDSFALRDQTLEVFIEHLPYEPCWPKLGEKEIAANKRNYVSTYPTMLNNIRDEEKNLSSQLFPVVSRKLKLKKTLIQLRNRFTQNAEKAKSLKSIKAQYQRSLQELENLYGSLSQRAFRGEVGVSKNQGNSITA